MCREQPFLLGAQHLICHPSLSYVFSSQLPEALRAVLKRHTDRQRRSCVPQSSVGIENTCRVGRGTDSVHSMSKGKKLLWNWNNCQTPLSILGFDLLSARDTLSATLWGLVFLFNASTAGWHRYLCGLLLHFVCSWRCACTFNVLPIACVAWASHRSAYQRAMPSLPGNGNDYCRSPRGITVHYIPTDTERMLERTTLWSPKQQESDLSEPSRLYLEACNKEQNIVSKWEDAAPIHQRTNHLRVGTLIQVAKDYREESAASCIYQRWWLFHLTMYEKSVFV